MQSCTFCDPFSMSYTGYALPHSSARPAPRDLPYPLPINIYPNWSTSHTFAFKLISYVTPFNVFTKAHAYMWAHFRPAGQHTLTHTHTHSEIKKCSSGEYVNTHTHSITRELVYINRWLNVSEVYVQLLWTRTSTNPPPTTPTNGCPHTSRVCVCVGGGRICVSLFNHSTSFSC